MASVQSGFTYILLINLLCTVIADINGDLKTATGFGADDTPDIMPAADKRAAIAEIKNHIRGLATARERVPPFWTDKLGAEKVNVTVFVHVLAVLGMDDMKQSLNTGNYLKFIWRDESLAWNASEHRGVEEVVLPVESLWTPTISVINTPFHTNLLSDCGVVQLKVTSDGRVSADLPVYLTTSCSLSLDQYPYDEQTCPILIMSFVDNLNWHVQQDAVVSQALATSLSMDAEWDIVDTSTDVVSLAVEDDPSLRIVIRLRRKTVFYTVCLVLPMVLTSYMNTLVFLLPLQSGEKVSFLVSIFVSTSVFISYFTTVMPRGLDSVPSTMKLLIGTIIESLIVLLANIVVLRRFHQEQEQHQMEQNDSSAIGLESALKFPETKNGPFLLKRDSPSRALTDDVSGSTKMAAEGAGKVVQWKKAGRNIGAETLDRVFFVLSFLCNTVFLAFCCLIRCPIEQG